METLTSIYQSMNRPLLDKAMVRTNPIGITTLGSPPFASYFRSSEYTAQRSPYKTEPQDNFES